jgi:putative DNA-invertase from lambdoid prophage Rac
MTQRTLYYGRISTTDGQNAGTQIEAARLLGVDDRDVHIDEGVSGYHVAPQERPEWSKVEHKLRSGDVLYVRWLDRISRRYDELHATMQRLMHEGVKVVCTLNNTVFDGATTDPMQKGIRDALLVFMAAQGDADFINRREMQRQGIDKARRDSPEKYTGRPPKHDAAAVNAWRSEHGASIARTAEQFGIGRATVARYWQARKTTPAGA